MRTVVRLLGLEIVIAKEDRAFIAADGEKVLLSEELGWWDSGGRIWVWNGLRHVEKWGVGVHEVVEYLLESKVGLKHEKAHRIAEWIERILTLGQGIKPEVR